MGPSHQVARCKTCRMIRSGAYLQLEAAPLLGRRPPSLLLAQLLAGIIRQVLVVVLQSRETSRETHIIKERLSRRNGQEGGLEWQSHAAH